MQLIDNKDLKEIINKIKYEGKFRTQGEIAIRLGYTQQYLSDVLNSRVPISVEFTNKLIETFPELNTIYLPDSADEMLKNSNTAILASPIASQDDYRMVPIVNFDAVGGMQTENSVSDIAEYVLGYVPFPRAQRDDICMRVTGNSMIPTYPSGSILLLREVPDWRDYFGYGHAFVLVLYSGRRILKEVTRSEEDPRMQILCVSHNRDFPAEELSKSHIKSVYKVVISQNYEGF